MASYSSPSWQQIKRRTGLNFSIEGWEEADLKRKLIDLRGDAEAKLALVIGESAWDGSSLTARQVSTMQRAVCLQTAAFYLRSPEVEKVTGTQEPLLMEDGGDIAAAADRMETEAEGLVNLVNVGTTTTPFARPKFRSSTYTADENLLPSERLADLSEADDVPAHTTLDD